MTTAPPPYVPTGADYDDMYAKGFSARDVSMALEVDRHDAFAGLTDAKTRAQGAGPSQRPPLWGQGGAIHLYTDAARAVAERVSRVQGAGSRFPLSQSA